eukprot:m.21150 g.21150  ORF g.21150 m.21150 type:complete len:272 (+) comp13276_c0_seq1:240-1055(+)
MARIDSLVLLAGLASCVFGATLPPSEVPTSLPTGLPTRTPTAQPTTTPTTSPTSPTTSPTTAPTTSPATSSPTTSSPTVPPSKTTITYTGYLVDTLCLTIINVNDFTNTTLNPDNHTLYCLQLPWCRDSGYSVLEHKGEYYESKYQITTADTPLVTAVLEAATCTSNFSVTVVGTVSGSIGDATYEGASTYNNGSLSFGTVLDISSITGHCGGNVVLPPATSGSSGGGGGDSTSWTVGATIAVVVCVVIALVIIVGLEMKGRKAERSPQAS